MLRNVLIISASGLVLFSKEFANAIAQPRLVGSLIRTMIEFSVKSAGMPVTHIELSHVGVSIVTDEHSSLVCALFYDRGDGAEFGRIMAGDILHAFQAEFARDLRGGGHNLREFRGFQYKIVDVVTDAIQPLLERVQGVRGVQKAVLVTDDSKLYAPVDVDQLAVLANLQAFLAVLSDAMDVVGDAASCVTMEGPKSSRILMWRMTQATFLLQCARAVRVEGPLASWVKMLKRVCVWMVQLSAAR
mmetsp:Transcript_6956/g.24737  ORF Transcript_6956/g.24737 Transcript_6956/m.24737 type:complete len:245 (-) Transcript_6956:94-828(-)